MPYDFFKVLRCVRKMAETGDQESTGYQSEILVTTKYRK